MHLWKRPTNLARSSLLVGPRRKKTDHGQRSAFPSETSRFAPRILVSWRGFSRPTPRRPAHLPFPERIWCLLTGSSLPFRFQSGTMTVGTNGLACGFNWQCTANDTGYAVSCSQHAWTPYRLLTSTVWVHPGREAARAGRGGARVSCVLIGKARDVLLSEKFGTSTRVDTSDRTSSQYLRRAS